METWQPSFSLAATCDAVHRTTITLREAQLEEIPSAARVMTCICDCR
jgi:hypothetical protein